MWKQQLLKRTYQGTTILTFLQNGASQTGDRCKMGLAKSANIQNQQKIF
jgi:hypothetical protein